MNEISNSIIKNGGEGVILRKPHSLYEHGKSLSLLKVKDMIDVQALVVGTQGAQYICKLPNENVVVATKKQKLAIKVGDVVTFSVVSRKKVRITRVHKIFVVRHDLLWQDVVNNKHVLS